MSNMFFTFKFHGIGYWLSDYKFVDRECARFKIRVKEVTLWVKPFDRMHPRYTELIAREYLVPVT